jgi:hypothetical protein
VYAGGFSFDPRACPQSENWLPLISGQIPAPVTNTLCEFLKADDNKDYAVASKYLSPEFDNSAYNRYASISNSKGSRIGIQGRPERFVTDERHLAPDTYQFVFENIYNNGEFQQSVSIRYADGTARVVGIQFGAY